MNMAAIKLLAEAGVEMTYIQTMPKEQAIKEDNRFNIQEENDLERK